MAFPPPPAGPSVPVSVVGPQYCAPFPVDVAVVSKFLPFSDGGFFVRDMNDRVIFNVKGQELGFGLGLNIGDHRTLIDAVGNPIVTLRREFISFYDRWDAFRGKSTKRSDLIFSVERSSILHLKPELDVFLANNIKENVCDFKVEGSWFDRSCVVYAGESSRILAQMHETVTLESALLRQDLFRGTIYANVDYAFIVLLIVIFVGIYKKDKKKD